jgi:hypothetical protein
LFGFGIPRKWFYSIEITTAQVKYNQFVGLVMVEDGEANEDKINAELRLVVNDNWDFQAKKVTDNEFLVIFPDKGTLETFSRIASLELPIHNLKVKIQKSNVDPATSSILQTCWVKISNIPPIARDEAVIR